MPLTNDQHCARKGSKCPVCGSTDLVGGEVTTGEGEATQEMHCGDCLAEWTDNYHLAGYRLVSDGVER